MAENNSDQNSGRSAREEAVTPLERSVSLLRQHTSASTSLLSTTTTSTHSNDDWEHRPAVSYRLEILFKKCWQFMSILVEVDLSFV